MDLANRLPPPWVIEDENERKKEKEQDEGIHLPTPSEPEHPPDEAPEDPDQHQVVIIDI